MTKGHPATLLHFEALWRREPENEATYLLPTCVASYMRQTLCHSLVLRNDETFVIECETWLVNVVMATVNLDYVALSSALPACVCVYREREGAI